MSLSSARSVRETSLVVGPGRRRAHSQSGRPIGLLGSSAIGAPEANNVLVDLGQPAWLQFCLQIRPFHQNYIRDKLAAEETCNPAPLRCSLAPHRRFPAPTLPRSFLSFHRRLFLLGIGFVFGPISLGGGFSGVFG